MEKIKYEYHQNGKSGPNLQQAYFEKFERWIWMFLEILVEGTKDKLG
jgi:hypothetical protein